jgi:hypothetical protein
MRIKFTRKEGVGILPDTLNVYILYIYSSLSVSIEILFTIGVNHG